ncbi:related to para-nitrobenzyl esterase [Melanopsichium pennsylvanicum]|uniref:Carboxylic ester hydrolase n=2 Tax=Melanopsichium pennsylvanicum TaxID=63383 RepID=A0AAJ5C8B3_9BASI|nr:related to Para-nitrobenzyl esterase [Melanopsichium pennsylvanicum 4]SNX87796.1 related to para-nitrobenzyl esterase [Melanopsichium pennsylvanicum]
MTLISSWFCFLCTLFVCLPSCDAAPFSILSSSSSLSASDPLLVTLPLGEVLGTNSSYNVQRFTLPYAAPPVGVLRFASTQPLSAFPNTTSGGVYDATQLPNACMQDPDSRYGINQDSVSEDCLYLNIFRPAPKQNPDGAKMPVLVWIHGGSFISGSSTAPGLDGSYLASQNGIIVVTIQYRLGMFGWFTPSAFTDEVAVSPTRRSVEEIAFGRYKRVYPTQGSEKPPAEGAAKSVYNRFNRNRASEKRTYNTIGSYSGFQKRADTVQGNQGLADVIYALRFITSHISSFGGDNTSITVAGQSSGAHMIRALLSSPAASPLFSKAILHSDPANYGTQLLNTSQLVSDYALSQTSCSDLACLRNMSAAEVLDASYATANAGNSIDSSVAVSEVFRPFIGSLAGQPLEQNPSAEAKSKSIIFTNVENEAGPVIGNMLDSTATGATSAELTAYPVALPRDQLLQQMFNDGRGQTIASAAQYGMNTSNTSSYPTPQAKSQLFSKATDGLRRNLEEILTQGMFICPNWHNALRTGESSVYVGLFEKGIQYPSNAGNTYCSSDNRVCHEDDIQLVFTDPSKVDDATARTVREVQARWVAFTRTGNPNTKLYGGWSSVGTSVGQVAKVMRLGFYREDGVKQAASLIDTVSLQAGQYAGCGQLWGGQIKYDWQLYG